MDTHVHPLSHLICPAWDFQKAMRLCSPALNGSGKYITGYLALTTLGSTAALRASDTAQLEITVAIPSATPPSAPFQLPTCAMRKLFKIRTSAAPIEISQTPQDRIHVEMDGIVLSLLAGQQTLTEAPAPICPPQESDPQRTIRVERGMLKRALHLASRFISSEETRYYLNGIAFQPHPADATAIILAATDGHRMVKHIISGITHCMTTPVIIPRAMITTLAAILANDKGQDDIDISFPTERPRCAISSTTFRIEGKLIDGTFPDFERVIPRGNRLAATFETAPLRNFCRRVRAFESFNENPPLKFIFDRQRKNISAEWLSSDIGRAHIDLPGVPEIDFEIGFNANYILDMLSAINAASVDLHVGNAAYEPVTFSAAGELADPATTIVLMPRRI